MDDTSARGCPTDGGAALLTATTHEAQPTRRQPRGGERQATTRRGALEAEISQPCGPRSTPCGVRRRGDRPARQSARRPGALDAGRCAASATAAALTVPPVLAGPRWGARERRLRLCRHLTAPPAGSRRWHFLVNGPRPPRLSRHVTGQGIEVGPGAHTFDLPFGGATVRFVDRWQPDEHRVLLPELGADRPVHRARHRRQPGQRRARLGADQSQDFVIGSHVLEHLANPLWFLGEITASSAPEAWSCSSSRIAVARSTPAGRPHRSTTSSASTKPTCGRSTTTTCASSCWPRAPTSSPPTMRVGRRCCSATGSVPSTSTAGPSTTSRR